MAKRLFRLAVTPIRGVSLLRQTYPSLIMNMPLQSQDRRVCTRHYTRSALTSEKTSSENEGAAAKVMLKLQSLSPNLRLGAGMVGGSVVLYGISRMFFDLASTLMELTPAVSLKYGFGFGVLSAGSLAAFAASVERAIRAQPEVAFQLSLPLLKNDMDINSVLGGNVKHPSDILRRERSVGGSFGVVNGRMAWKPASVQLVYSPPSVSPSSKVIVMVVTKQPLFGAPIVEFCGVEIRPAGSATGGYPKGGSSRRVVLKDQGRGTADEAAAAKYWATMEEMSQPL